MGKNCGGERFGQEMCDMQTLATGENERRNAKASACGVQASTSLDVPSAAIDVRTASAGDTKGDHGEDGMAGYHNRIVGTVWLVVATGGWWKAREISDATGLDYDCLHNRLNYMTQRRYLERRILAKEQRANTGAMGARERAEFSVGPLNMVPGGLTAQEVSQAVAGAR